MDKNEAKSIRVLIERLGGYQSDNIRNLKYFEGKIRPKPLGIAVPPSFQNVNEGVSWVRSGITAVSDRINFLGYDMEPGKEELAERANEVLRSNGFFSDFPVLVQDSLVFGCSFIVLGEGNQDRGEPKTLITVESPNAIAVDFHRRTRRVREAVHYIRDKAPTVFNGVASGSGLQSNENGYGTYYTETESIPFIVKDGEVQEDPDFARSAHGFPSCPVIFVPNSSAVGGAVGKSEITRPCRDIIDSTLRTLQNLEVSAEFHAAPQKYLIASEDLDDESIDDIKASLDKWMIFRDESAKVGRFEGVDPTPFINQIHLYRMEYANASGTPEGYLSGFSGSGNPTSADSINAQESRLNKRSERYIDGIAGNLSLLASLILGKELGESGQLSPTFAPTQTVSFGAVSDGLTKLIASGAIQPQSDYVYKAIGMNREDIKVVRREMKEAQAQRDIREIIGMTEDPSQS